MNAEELKALPAVVDVPTAARALGLGRAAAYQLVKDGQWPTPVFRVGKQIRIPTAPLLTLLAACQTATTARPPACRPRRVSDGAGRPGPQQVLRLLATVDLPTAVRVLGAGSHDGLHPGHGGSVPVPGVRSGRPVRRGAGRHRRCPRSHRHGPRRGAGASRRGEVNGGSGDRGQAVPVPRPAGPPGHVLSKGSRLVVVQAGVPAGPDVRPAAPGRPGRLPDQGRRRVGHDHNSAAARSGGVGRRRLDERRCVACRVVAEISERRAVKTMANYRCATSAAITSRPRCRA